MPESMQFYLVYYQQYLIMNNGILYKTNWSSQSQITTVHM